MAEKMFIHIAKKASFTSELQSKYTNSIVFIKDTQEIWTHGTFYAIPEAYKNKITSLESAVEALQSAYGFNTISDGKNSAQAQEGATTIKFTGTGGTTVTVGTGGVTINTKDYAEDIAEAKKAGDDAADALGTYKTTNDAAVKAAKDQADAALAEAQKKVASVKPIANKGIDINGTATDPTIGIKIDETTAGNVTLSVGANGLKANVTLPTVDYPVTSVNKIDANSAINVNPTTKDVKVGLNLDSSGNVTLSQSATGLKAAIDLSSYATKEDLGKLKDMVVSGGEIVTGTAGLFEGVEVGKKYLKLTIANSDDDVYIAVNDLVDVYDGAKLLLKSVTDETTYTAPVSGQSVDKAISLLIKGVADAQAKANEAVNKAGVTSFGKQTGEIIVKSGSTTNGSVNFSMSGNELNGTVYGLGTAAYTASNAYATSAQGAKADSALQSVTITEGTYIKVTKGGTATAPTFTIDDSIFGWEEL